MSVVQSLVVLLASSLRFERALHALSAQRESLAWWLIWAALCVLAHLTNPTAATFRTHLTSLTFHTHLRRLSSSESDLEPPLAVRATGKGHGHRVEAQSSHSGGHVLSFSNRISLSVKTPPYSLRSYVLFSTVIMAPPPASLIKRNGPGRAFNGTNIADVIEEGNEPFDDENEVGGLWIGAFGRWYAWNFGGVEAEEDERRERLAKGILAMEAHDLEKDLEIVIPSASSSALSPDLDSPISPTSSTSRTASTHSSTRPPRSMKRNLRQAQRQPPPTSLARLRSKAESSSSVVTSPAPPVTPPIPIVNGGSHLKAHSEGDEYFLTKSPKDRGLPGLPFHVARSHPPLPGHFTLDSTTVTHDPGAAVVEELKSQIDELQTTTEDSEKKLQEELEGLRERKREEDVFRAELKGRTKALEEQKRIAELSKVEAERKLGEKKVALRRVGERVDRIRDELGLIDRRELEVIERKEKKKRDRKEREKKLREDVIRKKEELKSVQVLAEKLRMKTVGLGQTIDSRREVLIAKRNEVAAWSEAEYLAQYRRLPVMGGQPMLPFHPGMTTSRPSSLRNHDRHSSAPTSPTLSHAHLYDDDHRHESHVKSSEPSAFYSNGFVHPTNSTGFLEHRMLHRRVEPELHKQSTTFVPLEGTLPSVEDIPVKFLPFDFDFDSPGPIEPIAMPVQSSQGHHSPPRHQHGRPQLSLPLQYLESGLLAVAVDGEGVQESQMGSYPLSPMTPHQASLIPSHLFHMMDDDENDLDLLIDLPESPSLGRRSLDIDSHSTWSGLGLESMEPELAGAGGGLGVEGHWEGRSLSHPSSRQLSPSDDLPRSGLSLNPDAKSFKFQSRVFSSPSPTLSSNSYLPSPPPSSALHTIPSRNSSELSPTLLPPALSTGFYTSVLAKSRMDFSKPPSTLAPFTTSASGSTFDWQKTSPRLATLGHGTSGSGSGSGSGLGGFNPFGDDDDELLGKRGGNRVAS